jgi:hypothetical protein
MHRVRIWLRATVLIAACSSAESLAAGATAGNPQCQQREVFEPMMDEMLERGYVVAYGNYRNEIPDLYNAAARTTNVEDTIAGEGRTLKSSATLDSDDYVALIEHLRALEYVRGVGTVGVSHSGELQAKAAAVITWDAGVLIEGASHEFLVVDVLRMAA